MENEKTPKEDRGALVVRDNKLIESRHRLSLMERRFMLWIISQIRREDSEVQTYCISIRRFIRFCGLKDNDLYYPRISEMADSLTQRNIAIRTPEKKKEEYYSWFSFIRYNWGEGEITARLNDEIKPFLLQLKEHYTAITLEYALLLKGACSHRLYDLLKQYERIGERTMDIARMKEIFDIAGKYPKYKDFRVWVIEPAQKEINQKTDISFDFEPIKDGRRTSAIRFVIHQKPAKVTLDNSEETDPDTKAIFRKLVKHGVEEDTARSLVADYDPERIKWHIDKYEARKKSDKPPEGAGWLIDGIRKDYRPQRSIFEKEEEEARAKRAEEKQRKKELHEAADRIKKDCNKHDREARIAIFEAMTEQDRGRMYESLTERFSSVPAIFERIKKQETENPMVMGLCLG
jgi:plasmid replication initiation protein